MLDVGATKSLGVFFWATDSSINHDPRFAGPFDTVDYANTSAIIPEVDVDSD